MNTMDKQTKILVLMALAAGAYFMTTRGQAAQSPARTAAKPVTLNGTTPTLPGSSNPVATGIGFLKQILAPLNNGFVGQGQPTSTNDGNQGEAAAQKYLVDNADSFAINPPALYQTDTQSLSSTGGWLDGQ